MVATDFGALSAARKKVWGLELTQQGRDESFWMMNGFVGANTANMNVPVQRITELTKTERGETAIMQLVADLVGDGVAGDNILEGNEEALFNDTLELNIDQLRMAVRSKGKMAEQRTVIRFRSVGREKLAFRMAEVIDEMMFLTIAGVAFTSNTNGSTRSNASQLPDLKFAADVTAASANRILYAGSATSTATLTANDTMNWNLIVKACTMAKRKKIKPIRSGGKPYYAIVLSTEQCRDLKTDPTYQTLVAKAHYNGPRNPLFNNAIAVIDGAILYDHNKTYNTLGAAGGNKWGAGSTVDGAQSQLFGSQAMGLATLGPAEYDESDNTDYKNRPGMAVGRTLGMVKPVYRSTVDGDTDEDFGTISIRTAAAA